MDALDTRTQVRYRHSVDGLDRLTDEISSLVSDFPSADRATGEDGEQVLFITERLIDVIAVMRDAQARRIESQVSRRMTA